MNAFSNFTDRTAKYRTEAEYDRINQIVRSIKRDQFRDRAGIALMVLTAVFVGFACGVQF